jgi:hypothetical protein
MPELYEDFAYSISFEKNPSTLRNDIFISSRSRRAFLRLKKRFTGKKFKFSITKIDLTRLESNRNIHPCPRWCTAHVRPDNVHQGFIALKIKVLRLLKKQLEFEEMRPFSARVEKLAVEDGK